MKLSPGKWSEMLFEGSKTGAPHTIHNFGDYGDETAAAVMDIAQERVSRFTVVIGTTGMEETSKEIRDLAPGSGVIVRLYGEVYGLLTAGHVLRRGDNSKDSVAALVLVPPSNRNQSGEVMALKLSSRPCTVFGFDNETEEGPDIAIIPLASGEWRILEGWGMVAYNLNKERWSDEERAELGEMAPWVLSIINGVRFEASQIVYSHSDGERGSLAIVASNTHIEVVAERRGYDYLELPAEVMQYSYPTHWRNKPPGTAAEEIDELHDEGVTRRVWGGSSGAGVWNLVIGTTECGTPNGRVLVALAGVCFYANPRKGCIIAHGTKSIAKVVATHLEKEAIRYHTKT